MPNDIYERRGNRLILHLHPGQTAAWDSQRRFVFVIAGTQSGKTTFGPHWLNREIKERGSGDYLAVTATYDLFKLKMLPEIRRVFELTLGGWTYQANDRVLYSDTTTSRSNTPTKARSRIILRSANSPGGLESATALGAWLDECGQDEFKLDSLEATNRRLALEQGRILGTTTPYNMGWLKQEVYDRWTAGDMDYQVIQFASTMNPAFPRAEFERAERTLPPWKFAMFYRGQFARPAGMIYDCFSDAHKIAPFAVNPKWPRFGGMDFGGVHTAAVCIAQDPATGVMYAIKEYMHGGRTAAEHAAELKQWNCRLWVGGSKSEGQWRSEFAAAGMPINEPRISDVEVGIARVYGAHKTNSLYVFNTLARYLDEKGRYSREIDDMGQPVEAIKDKNDYHMMDAERYIVGFLAGGVPSLPEDQPTQTSKWLQPDDQPAGWARRY